MRAPKIAYYISMPPDKPQWKELYSEVVTSGLCTGCSACVIVCPHDVLDYDDKNGAYKPFHLDIDGGKEDCTHGQRGCTLCTRACPRFRDWESEIDIFMHGRNRTEEEVSGIYQDIILARTTDSNLQEVGQDGGVVTSILLYALENDIINGALISELENDSSSWKAIPTVATTKEEIVRGAGSRYTYSANPIAYLDASNKGIDRLALVGMGCQASVPNALSAKKAGKTARRFVLTIGLLCSKTFDDAIFDELFDQRYGIKRETIKKMNIKGVFQIWCHDGSYHEIPLKEAHHWTREGCKMCPDFGAEHADISAGGIGKFADWTLLVIRTDRGKEIIDGMIKKGLLETKPSDEDQEAVELMHKLARISRKRWPEFAAQRTRKYIPVK